MGWKEIAAIGIVLIAVLLVFALILPYIWILPWGRPPPIGAPTWQFKGWWQFGRQVDTAIVNQPVTLRLEIVGQVVSVGTLGIEIRKDIPFAFDVTVYTDAKTLSLVAGQNVTVETTFTPDQPTGDLSNVREYFFKLYWNGISIYDPTTPGQRNGLQVTEGGGAVTYQGGEFEG